MLLSSDIRRFYKHVLYNWQIFAEKPLEERSKFVYKKIAGSLAITFYLD